MRIGALVLDDLTGTAHAAAHRPRGPLLVIQRGCVAGCCGVARALGVEIGWDADRATRLAPTAEVVPRDGRLETAFWEDVRGRVHHLTPFLEDVRPGLLYFRLEDPSECGALADELGARIGLAPSRRLARIAAATAAPGTIAAPDIADEAAEAFLARVPARTLQRLGIDEEMVERLQLFGLDTLGEVAGLSRRHLTQQFGEEGAALHELLHPRDEPRMSAYQPPPTAAATLDLDAPGSEPGHVLPVLKEALRRATADLGDRETQHVRITLAMRQRATASGLHAGQTHTSASRLLHQPTADLETLWHTVRHLGRSLLKNGIAVDALRVALGALSAPETAQGSLFTERPAARQAIQAAESRHPGSLLRARKTSGFFPEEGYTLEPVRSSNQRAPDRRALEGTA